MNKETIEGFTDNGSEIADAGHEETATPVREWTARLTQTACVRQFSVGRRTGIGEMACRTNGRALLKAGY